MDYVKLLTSKDTKNTHAKKPPKQESIDVKADTSSPKTRQEKTEEPPQEHIIGLSRSRAAALLEQYGSNTLKKGKKKSRTQLFVSQFKDVFTVILIIAVLLSVYLGEGPSAITILIIIGLNAILGFFQQYRTENTIEKLKKLTVPNTIVYRDGIKTTLKSSDIVPTDIVVIKAGDRIPADGVLVDGTSVLIDESILTGEAHGVEKEKENDDLNKVFSGTLVTSGKGKIRVTHTGMNTEIGKIAHMLKSIDDEPTPLQIKLNQLGKFIGLCSLAVCFIVAIAGVIRGEDVVQMAITGMSLAVAAVPEGLPAIVTISLALAVNRVLKHGVIIKKLHVAETMGCATVICSDKTGTITENRMELIEMTMCSRPVDISDVDIVNNSSDPSLVFFIKSFPICCNATKEGEEYVGEPTEIGIVKGCSRLGADKTKLDEEFIRIEENPFDSTRKMMSVKVKTPDMRELSVVKGAADKVILGCTQIMIDGTVVRMTSGHRQQVRDEIDAMTQKALRVLGSAFKYITAIDSEPESGLTYLGLVGLYDPPRPDVFEAVKKCKRAGIRPVMITGDHKNTAIQIAKEIEILSSNQKVLTGDEIEEMDDDQFGKAISKTAVFARVSPAHKLKIVAALKRQGNVVAMTGDGVNDAPAVKEADIGICMGSTGSDVTKEAAGVILLKDSFSAIVTTVLEGRIIYANIKKFIRYLLSCNIGEVLTMFIGMIMGLPIILLPIQILLINLVTDGLPAMALGMDRGSDSILLEKPRKTTDGIFAGGLLSKILFRGCLIALATVGSFVMVITLGGSVVQARTGAFLCLVVTQLIHAFECKDNIIIIKLSTLFDNLFLLVSCIISILIIFLCIFFTPLQGIFGTTALSLEYILVILIYSSAPSIISSIAFKKRHKLKKY